MRQRRQFIMLFVLLVGGAILCAMQISRIQQGQEETQELYTELQTVVETTLPEAAVYENPFEALQEMNGDFVGWLEIPDTTIDFPVVYPWEEEEYYLTHSFLGGEDAHGVPFVDVSCQIDDWDNLVVYGHHMRDGTMFAPLQEYLKPEFREAHSLIRFDTPQEPGMWQVILVFRISAAEAIQFPYHLVSQFRDGTTIRDYLSRARLYADWMTEEPVPEDGKLLTLSTCEYSQDNGRLVVVAQKVS